MLNNNKLYKNNKKKPERKTKHFIIQNYTPSHYMLSF